MWREGKFERFIEILRTTCGGNENLFDRFEGHALVKISESSYSLSALLSTYKYPMNTKAVHGPNQWLD